MPRSRRPAFQVEELEARLLYSADFAALAVPLQAPALMAFALPADDESLDESLTAATASTAERPAQPARHEIVFVDAAVADAGVLLGDLAQDGRTVEVVWLDAGRDGVDQISQALAGRHDLAAVHIVSHGGAAALQLGAGTLDAAALAQRAEQVARWGDALAADADLLLYGCDVASGEVGTQFVADLALLTGADVAASDDTTGHAARGGDWTLEVHAGAIDTALVPTAAAQQRWVGALATYTVSNTNDSGAGSLRQAISDANANAGTDTIAFSIGGGGAQTIAVTSSLPSITGTTVVDGRTQGGYAATPLIELDGSAAGANVDGLTFSSTADGSSVYGLAIVNFDYDGIWLAAGADGITVRGNYLGIGVDGVTAKPNYGGIGIYSANNVIGGTAAADRNVISGNLAYGMYLPGINAANNLIQGNYIGTNAAGTAALANATGIVLYDGAHDNTIGGTASGARNVISGNSNGGVDLTRAGTSYNTIVGNYIGTNADGTAAIANNVGVYLASGTHHNTIGGTAAGAGNLISGNAIDGIQMLDAGTSYNTVAGNIIGLNAAGTGALANTNQGIAIFLGASNNTIGGTAAGAGNIISGNDGDGVRIEGLGTTGNVVSGNTIGLNGAGTAIVANGIGIRVSNNASANTIGGTATGAGNVIAGNTQQGVLVEATASGISILGNSIRDNGALGIDLDAIGVTANDAGDGDTGANTLQNFPLLADAFSGGGNTTVNGTLNSTASSSFRIEFFSSSAADGSGHGEGATYLGFLDITTDASGNATFSALLAGVSVLSGHRVTATATFLSGGTPASTSEFAQTVAATVAPVHTVPGAQVTPEDTTLIFSAANGNAISIGDDSGASLEVVLSVGGGTLTLSQLTGLAITAGANGSASMTVSGSVADLNAALDGLAYQPGANYHGGDTLTITSSDAALVSLNLDAALAARYAFDDPLSLGADASDNAQTGTVVGAVAATDTARGGVLSLDGAGDHVFIAGMLGNPGQVTLSAWVYVDPSDAQGEVISLGDNVQLRVDHNGTRVSASFYDGTGFRKTESGDVMTTGGWHHIVYVVDDAADKQTVYIDGAAVASTSFTGSISYTRGTDTYIGIHGNGNTNYDYKGLIDEARVFGRALSATEVMALALTDTDRVAITVNSVNDAVGPVADADGAADTVAENAADGSTVGITAVASDPDGDMVTYSLSDAAGGRFAIDGSTGVVTVADGSLLDYEAATSHTITVLATSTDGSTSSRSFTIGVTDLDEFNIGPVADIDAAADTVAENAADGSTVGITASASDPDGSNNTVTYSLSDDAGGRFAIDGSTGMVTVADGSLLDYEAATSHAITVLASSSDGSTSSRTFTVAVGDIDEFDVGAVTDIDAGANTVAENAADGATVGITASATDADGSNNTITYSLSDDAGGRFTIDGATGVVSVLDASLLDYETSTSHLITVLASSADGSTASQSFSIDVTDTSEFGVGAIADADAAADQISEDAPIGGTVGITAQATDPDGTDTVSYSLDDDADGRFVIDAGTGIVTTAAALDAETALSHSIVVRATSSDLSFSTRSFTITVGDVDEFDVGSVTDSNATVNTVAENAANGSTVGITASATDADGSNNMVTYSLSDDAGGRFAIDASTGVVTVADSNLLDYETATSHAITVLATSTDGSTASRSFTVALIDVNDNSPVITSNGGGTAASISVPENETAVTTVVASDADLPAQTLVYSIAGGADASRFTIDGTTGVLSFAVAPDFESPADADADNVYEVVVRAGDGAGGETTQALSVAVTGVDEAPLAAPDTVTGDEDTLLSGNVLANDSDPEGQPLQAALLTGPAHGEVTLNADGSFTYRPAADWFGTDGYTYRVSVVGSTADGVVILEVRPVNDTAVVTQAHLQMEQGVPAVLDTRALDASDVDGDRMSIAFELGSISGGRIERADAPGVAVDRFTVAELVGGQLRVVPTGGALEIVLRTFDGETPGEWVSMRIDTLPAAPEAPPSEPTAPAPPAAPIAPDAGLAPPAPPPAAPPPPAPLAASPPQEADLAASTPDLAPAPVVASATTEQGAAMPSTAALAPRFAAERIALAAGTSGAASSAAAGGASSPRADAGPVQLVVDLQFEVVQQRLAAGLNAPAAARALSVGLSPPDAADAEPAMAEAANRLSANVEAVEVAGLTLTVGVIWWALRLAGVAGSLLVSLPAWGMIDPLPILGAPPDDDDDDAADSSRDPDDAVDEDAIAEVLARPANTRTAARP